MMKKTAHGFTLVEILVVITIMAFIGAFSLANFRSFGEDQKLKNAALDIQSLLRTAQANSTTKAICDSKYDAIWQVVISSSSVLAATSTSPSPSPNGTTVYQVDLRCQESGTTFPKKTLTLDRNISLSVREHQIQQQRVSVVQEVNPCPDIPVTISFAPLTGKIDLGGTQSITNTTCSKLTFTLTNSKTGSTKDLIIEQGGRVYVQ